VPTLAHRRTIALVEPGGWETALPFAAAGLAELRERGWDAELVGELRRPRGAWLWRRSVGLLSPGPEVVHFGSARSAAAAGPTVGALGASSVVSLGGEELYGTHPGDLERVREGCRGADLLHLSDEVLWERAREIGCPESVSREVLPPAADPRLLEIPRPADAARGEQLRLLSLGALTWMGGFEYALQAVRLLLDRGIACRCRVVGEGPDVDDLVIAREQLGLQDAVELVPDADRDRVREELRAADVYLHTAVIPGLGQGVVDAQAAALPVVTADGGPLVRMALSGTGALVSRRDPAGLAEAIAALAEDPEARERIGQAGRARVSERFRLDAQVDGFVRLYTQALAGRHRSRKSAPKV
jgi:colanic acid/amylovoran biosynthesis glycosyltransferase